MPRDNRHKFILTILFYFFLNPVFPQFNLNGNAVSLGGGCYRLTQAINSQVGTAWAPNLIDLNNSFDLQFDIYLGCNNSGADGVVFGLQPVSTSAGGGGSGIGFGGITPSIGIEFDTYKNGFDPVFDHCAIVLNGDVNHNTANTVAGPIQINPNNGNVEDCNYHRIRITWDPVTQLMEVYYGCTLRLSHTFSSNVITSIFAGNSMVYWGFTAATGGFNNEHRFCIVSNPFQSTTQIDSICAGDSVQLTFTGASTHQWNTSIGISNDTIGNPYFNPSVTDTFSLTLTDSCGNSWLDTAIIHVEPDFTITLGNDTLLCPGENMTMNPNTSINTNFMYTWSNGTTADTLIPTLTGTYGVTVSDSGQVCTHNDEMDVVLMPAIQLDLGNDSILCDGDQLVLNIYQDSAYYLWQDGSTQSSFIVDSPGVYWVTKLTQCDTLQDTITFDSIPRLMLDLGNDTLLCNGQSLLLDAYNQNANYLWNTTSTDSAINVTTTNIYMVTVSSICENLSDTILVDFVGPPQNVLPPDGILCDGTQEILTVLTTDTGFLWSDGSTDDTLIVTTPGVYHLALTNLCGTAYDTVEFFGLTAPQIDLGPDVNLCPGQTATFNASYVSSNYNWSTGSIQSQITESTAGLYTVTVTNACGNFIDSVRIDTLSPPVVILPSDTTLCAGYSINIIPTLSEVDTLIWSTGTSDSILLIGEPGTYNLIGRNICGQDRDEITIDYLPEINLELGGDTGLCIGDLLIQDIRLPGLSYLWNTGSTEGLVQLEAPGEYAVTVTDTNLCQTSDTIELFLDCPWTFFVPNAFTPNNDNLNDYIGITGLNLYDLHFYVFDRWGNELFHSTSTEDKWNGAFDGTRCSQGVYVWKATFQTAEGNSYERLGHFLLFHQ